MAEVPASREEIASLVGEAEDSYVERILRTRATTDEIKTALGDIRGQSARAAAPSKRAATVRGILEDLFREKPSKRQ
jgi:hypothetical protein